MKKKGAALLSVVIIMTAAFFIAAIVVDRSIKSSRRIMENLNDTRAYYYAESLVYDMADYIIKQNNNAVNGTSAVKTADGQKTAPAGMTLIDDPELTSYKVTLASDVKKTLSSSTAEEYTYNVESSVLYRGRKYTVKLQLVEEYTNSGGTFLFSGHRINDKRAFRS